MALARKPEPVSFPFLSSVKKLSEPATTIGTFADLLFGSVNDKRDPAEGQTEDNQQNENHPAGLGHFFFNDGHAYMVTKGTF
jgi:hypothetical protein